MRNFKLVTLFSLVLAFSSCTGSDGGQATGQKLAPVDESGEIQPAQFLIRVRAPVTNVTLNYELTSNRGMSDADTQTGSQGAFPEYGWQNIYGSTGYTFEGYIVHASVWDPLEIELYVNGNLTQSATISNHNEVFNFQSIDVRSQ